MPDDAYSPIPELNLLKQFDERCEEAYAPWAWLDDFRELSFLRDTPELMRGLTGFAYANHSGSLYALWKRDDRADLAALPVVLLGDEGGLHLVARDLREFFRLLAGLEADLACDWDDVYERDEEELPARADYHAWLEENFGLTPPEDAWDIIEAAQEELGKEWAEWIHPLLPGAVFSPVHELNLLKRFQDGTKESYAGGFFLLSSEDREDWDGDSDLMPVAEANDDFDTYALWLRDDRSDLMRPPGRGGRGGRQPPCGRPERARVPRTPGRSRRHRDSGDRRRCRLARLRTEPRPRGVPQLAGRAPGYRPGTGRRCRHTGGAGGGRRGRA